MITGSNGQSLSEELQLAIKDLRDLYSGQLDALRKNMYDVTLPCGTTLEGGTVIEVDTKLVDALDNIVTEFEKKFTKITYEDYSLTALQEAKTIYQTRIDTLIEVQQYIQNQKRKLPLSKRNRLLFRKKCLLCVYALSRENMRTCDHMGCVSVLLDTIKDENGTVTGYRCPNCNREYDMDENTERAIRVVNDDGIMELNKFIKEKSYTNSDIGVNDITNDVGTVAYQNAVDELYRDACTVFSTMYLPFATFTVDIVNLYRDIECQHDWDKISIGDMVHVGHMDSCKPDYIVRVTKMVYDPSKKTMNNHLIK